MIYLIGNRYFGMTFYKGGGLLIDLCIICSYNKKVLHIFQQTSLQKALLSHMRYMRGRKKVPQVQMDTNGTQTYLTPLTL